MRRPPPSQEDSEAPEQLGVLTRERRVRLLNCSVSGCLIETNWRLQVGAIASIRVVIEGRELTDESRSYGVSRSPGPGIPSTSVRSSCGPSRCTNDLFGSPPSFMTTAATRSHASLRALPENY